MLRTLTKLVAVSLVACSLSAASVTFIQPAAVAACATTDTPILHDEFLEGFQTATTGVNDQNAWTTTETDTASYVNPVFDVSAIFSDITGACSQGLQVTVPNTDEQHIRWDRGSELDLDTQGVLITVYVRFSTLALSGTENHSIFTASGAALTQCFLLTLQYNTDHHELKVDASVDAATTYTVVADTTYKVEVYLATTTSASWFDVNDASGTGNTFTRYGSRDFQYIHAGAPTGVDSTDGGSVIIFDLIHVDKQ